MQCRRLLILAVVLLAITGSPSAGLAADESPQKPAARRAAPAQLHSRMPADRTAAMRRLAELPALEGAKVVVQTGLKDRAPEVRRAAYEMLLGWKDDDRVCNYLLTTLDRESRAQGGAGVAAPLVAVLLASELPDAQRGLGKFLETYLAKSKEGVGVVASVADELGTEGDEQAIAALERLAQQKCFSESFACRRASVQAMIRIRRPQAVAALITLLPGLEGEVRAEVVRHLTEVSGQQHGNNTAAWQTWWKEHGAEFDFPAAGAPAVNQGMAPGDAGSYYGLPLNARRMVFVIDISGSMMGPRIAAAKRELANAIRNLPESAELSIVAFNARIAVWQRSLTRATPAAKESAAAFIYNLMPSGQTAAHDALEAAFRFDAEAIYFLSDGAPNAGRIIAPAEIIAAISRENHARRISIYTIGIAPGRPGGPLELFLKTLAERNFGVYQRVDQ
jgi:hypothetical protein